MSYRLSYYTVKRGRNRPSVNLFQIVAAELGRKLNQPSWNLVEDGLFGRTTEKIAKEIQQHYGLEADGLVGQGTWRTITEDLGCFRTPLRLRIAECQCTWEAGKGTYGYYGIIPAEGWWNYGIWNVNKHSAKTLVSLGGASWLKATIDKADSEGLGGKDYAAEVGSWFGSKNGIDTQIGSYFLEYTIKPSLGNLVSVGWDPHLFGVSDHAGINAIESVDHFDSLARGYSPFIERLVLQACDITVNSGAGGFFPTKSPREWSGGKYPWPEDRLPSKKDCQKAFEDAFGGTISHDREILYAPNRANYKNALRTILWEICENDEQRIEVTGELQARCVIDSWRNMVIERRRAVARTDGHFFQGVHFNVSEHFGIGVDE